MFRVLFLMLILLIGLIVGPYIAGKQGYVLIQTDEFNYELSIVSLVILFVIMMSIVYGIEWILIRFSRLSNKSYTWFSRRKKVKAQKQTLQGLMRMNEGNYSKAEKLIGKYAKHSDEPVLNFIKAAEAAQQRGDEFNANKYLMEATELAGPDNLALELARTRILLQQNKLPAARSSVDSLLEMTRKNPEVLKLAVEIYQKSKAYQALDQIMNLLTSCSLYSSVELTELQHRVENGLLDEVMNEQGVDGLLDWWERQPRKRRNSNYVRVALIERLIDCNDHQSAYDLVIETLKKLDNKDEFNVALLKQIIRLQADDSSKLIKILSKRIKYSDAKTQCCIQRALGYLYLRDVDFANAANAFKQVALVKDQLDATDINMASYVFEQVGEYQLANQLRNDGLKAAMSVDVIQGQNMAMQPLLLEHTK